MYAVVSCVGDWVGRFLAVFLVAALVVALFARRLLLAVAEVVFLEEPLAIVCIFLEGVYGCVHCYAPMTNGRTLGQVKFDLNQI